MANRIKHWTVRRSRRRVAGWWEVRNTHGVVAIVYTTQADAELLAAAPKLLGCLKHLIAIVRLIPNLRASAKAKLADAEALVASINH